MTEREQLEQAIEALEAQRASLGDATVDAAVARLHQTLAGLERAEVERALEPTPPTLAGERKLVTIMFADISGFAALAETMDPEAARDLANACFECLVPLIEQYGGTVDKFLGDGVMALFGAPAAHENDPERALRAALGMGRALEEFNADRGIDLGVHFGINTGTVVAGALGTRDRQEYSVVGDAVNLAARLEDASERGEILVGPDTHRLTAPLFEFEARDSLSVKGRAEPVAVYRLVRAAEAVGKPRGIAGLDSPLVGRDAEFRAIKEAVERVRAGQGGIVTVVGEAGIGKSRLVAEVRREAMGEEGNGFRCAEGRCLEYGRAVAYLVWIDALRSLLGVTADDSPTVVREVLRGRVAALCPDGGESVYPYLGRLMGLPAEDDVQSGLRGLEAERLKAGTFRAVETLIEAEAQQQALVIVSEDLHWADPTSVELLETLLGVTSRVPLLLVCVFRPEMDHGCQRVRETAARDHAERHTDVQLEALSTNESATLVGNLLQAEELPEQVREHVLAHAEGNPFYVEEILRSLMDLGAIVRDAAGSRWEARGDLAEMAIPDTLLGVLAARIDRLEAETKRVLQWAAVVGRIFPRRVLAAVAGNGRRLDEHLLTLQQEELIREREPMPEPVYIFKHHMTQQAAYSGLLLSQRREHHAGVAEALEQLHADRVEERVGLLAHHWERAGETRKATDYLLRAGEQARGSYANAEAIDYYRRGLALLDASAPDEAATDWHREAANNLNEGLGDVLVLGGRQGEATDAYDRALARAPETDRLRRARLFRKRVGILVHVRQQDEAFQALQSAERALGDEPTGPAPEWWREWVQIQLERVQLHYGRAEPEEMVALVERARPMVEKHGTPVQRAALYQGLTMIGLRRERYAISQETLGYAQASLEASEESGILDKIAQSGFAVGFCRLWHGDLEGAEKELRGVLPLAERIGDAVVQTQCLVYLGLLSRMHGDVEATRSLASHAISMARAAQVLDYVGMAEGNRAWVAWRDGDFAAALEHGAEALEVWQKRPVPFWWMALWPLIAVTLEGDDVSEAVGYARSLLEPTQQRLPDAVTETLEKAIEMWDAGDSESARRDLDLALDLAQEHRYL